MSISEGVYWIRNLRFPNKVLDAEGAKTDQGTRVLDWDEKRPLNEKLNQLWIVEKVGDASTYIIRNVNSNLVLDLSGSGTANGTPIITWPQHGGANQQWRVQYSKDVNGTAYYAVVSVATGTVVSHNVNDNDAATVAWHIDDGPKQLWSFTPFVWPLSYRIRVKNTGRVLDLKGASAADGTLALAWDQHAHTTVRNQVWWLPKAPGSEGYTIQCVETRTVADLAAGKPGNNVPIYGWHSHGGRNQQWEIEPHQGNYQRIRNIQGGSVVDAYLNDPEKKAAGWTWHGGDNQLWLLDAIPSPGQGWFLIQNGGTGKFLCVNANGNIDTADGPETIFDGSVQWRFVQKDRTAAYTLVNRATGRTLRQLGSTIPSIGLGNTNDNQPQDWWTLETFKASPGLAYIVNERTGNLLDHYAGESVQGLDPAPLANNYYRAWKLISANDWLPSFALLNGATATYLSAASKDADIVAIKDVDNFQAQWVLRKTGDGPTFAIQNKANNRYLGGTAERFQLVVAADKYFAIRNVSTGKFLTLDANNKASFQDENKGDKRQYWELASSRALDNAYDVLYLDDDVLEVAVPYVGDKAGELKRYIANRAAGKPPKDKSGWSAPRSNSTDNITIHQLFHALIDRFDLDLVTDGTPSPIVSFNLHEAEAERVLGQRLPESIRSRFTNPNTGTVLSLERQFIDVAGNRFAVVQGRFGDVYLQVALPVGTWFGREQIRRFLRTSLGRSTIVVVSASGTRAPTGGPAPRRDAAANYWVKWASAVITLPVVKHSEL
ncbi:hypothetical protein CC1G_10075 [Coprinopsis cinerea okayama7|uniref:Ricin B lectin domain-containing protein n=1 Tax=Coprinopsis cinerea (strain Okayama-7 / 130 / ATCC MYA-4618 / FGSC 9003) TaxID=240176 RepID=A8NDT5_COPC7|nr:hypothetical protein CC1G_10075 [Coprinopsis cinerea okayama7\|eukprot:XP_001832856.1 hypothetical protein CC1G_10075 [Coprinopsis cinerea okayama7\